MISLSIAIGIDALGVDLDRFLKGHEMVIAGLTDLLNIAKGFPTSGPPESTPRSWRSESNGSTAGEYRLGRKRATATNETERSRT